MHIVERDELVVHLAFEDPDRALRVERGGQTVIDPSPIGLSTPAGEFPEEYELVDAERSELREQIHTARGKRREHDHRATKAVFEFEGGDGRRLEFELRLAEDGLGYRYDVGGDGVVNLFGSRPEFGTDESGFRLPEEALAWLFEYGVDHESIGRHHAAHRAGGEFSMPGLFHTNGGWVLIGEAGVDGRYAASRLATTEASLLFEYRMPRTTVYTNCPTTTPWRVAIVGDIETVGASSLVPQLVGEAEIDPEADWIEPGRVAWSWWSDSSTPGDAAVQREYIDYAADRGWEHVLLDMGWRPEDVPGLVEYAGERGVGLFLWSHWTDLHRTAERRRRLDRWVEWGVDGVKIDFMDYDDQGRHQFYDELIEAAAERELMLNFHGSIVPTGLSSRYPHVMTYEGVMGAEHYGVKGMPPEHNVTLVLTRNVVGPMDYTPVAFSADNRATSAGHELALSVAFESGLQHLADSHEVYADRPDAEWFLERVPAAWDETVVLEAWPGSEATVARRRDGDWFVGSITAGPARTVEASASFLPAERETVLIRDGEDDDLIRESTTVTPGETLSIDVAENGGFCAYLPGEE